MTSRVLKDTVEMLALKSVNNTLDLMPVIRKGLPSSALKAVSKRLEMTPQATGESLGIAKRTLARRLKDREVLSTEESERVVRLARILAYAFEVFGNPEKARRWLQKPNRALAGEIPLHMLDTDIGANAVYEELGRIDYGVFA
jgi:putative toxin-antitoxin system antitoxin component (TIGR02293 family)